MYVLVSTLGVCVGGGPGRLAEQAEVREKGLQGTVRGDDDACDEARVVSYLSVDRLDVVNHGLTTELDVITE